MILILDKTDNATIWRRKRSLSYKNGKEILPAKLLKELQKYIQGELIYVPKPNERAGWGENNGTRTLIAKRNHEIYMLHKNGYTIEQLTDRYCLSTDSIRKIIYKTNKENSRHAI